MKPTDNRKEVTIRDLATMLGLSVATVSRALNHDDSVKALTQRRVAQLAERLGYRGNDYARMLRRGQSQLIGCIVPWIAVQQIASTISDIEQRVREADYSLLVMQSQGSVEIEMRCATALFNRRVDGLIVAVADPGRVHHFQTFTEKNIPMVGLDHRSSGYEIAGQLIDRI